MTQEAADPIREMNLTHQEPVAAYVSPRVRLYGGNMGKVLEGATPDRVGVVLTDAPYVQWGYLKETDGQEQLDFGAECDWQCRVLRWSLEWLPGIRRMRPGAAFFFVEPHYAGFYMRIARYMRWPMIGWWDGMRGEKVDYLIAFSDWWGVDVPTWATIGAALTSNSYGQGKSPEMLEKILRVAPAGLVLDPFMGSGTTIVAALRAGREAMGIELNPGVLAGAVARVRRAEEGLK